MRQYVADTNALISFVTDRNPAQQVRIRPFFEQAAALECRIVIPSGVVLEFVYVLDKVYRVDRATIRDMVAAQMNTPGLEIRAELDLAAALELWPEPFPEFGDALVAAAAAGIPSAAVLTFDRSFRRALKGQSIPCQP
jgi:predicted nucleic-acid-binding protein